MTVIFVVYQTKIFWLRTEVNIFRLEKCNRTKFIIWNFLQTICARKKNKTPIKLVYNFATVMKKLFKTINLLYFMLTRRKQCFILAFYPGQTTPHHDSRWWCYCWKGISGTLRRSMSSEVKPRDIQGCIHGRGIIKHIGFPRVR